MLTERASRLALPLLAVLFTGCSAGGAGKAADETETETATPPSPVLVKQMHSRFLPEASVAGHLTLQHGCLVIRDVVAGDSVAYFPEGTTWEADTRTVRLSNGKTVSVGERFHGGGGFLNLDAPVEGFQAAVAEVPGLQACLEATHARSAVLAYVTGRSG